MPTRKQRRREAKQKRHEYEFVYVDDEGNEIDPPPEELEAAERSQEDRRNGKAVATKPAKGKTQQRGGRTVRVPQPPSWQRASRRALLLGAVVFVLFYSTNRGGNKLYGSLGLAVLYTALFIPFTYWIDRFAYRRYQARQPGTDKKPSRRS
jgi:hypothetical protein